MNTLKKFFVVGMQGGAFNPLNVSGLIFAQYGDTGCRPLGDFTGAECTEGESIGSWEDKRGGAVGFIQPIAGNQPTYSFNTGGSGPPGMVDDGTNWLAKAYTIPDQMTVFVSYNGRSGTNGCLFGNSDGGNSPLQRNADFWWSVAESNITFSGGATLNAANIMTATYDYIGGASLVRLDGVQRGSRAASALTKPTGDFQLGNGFSEPLTGNITCALGYNRILTETEMEQVEAWLVST